MMNYEIFKEVVKEKFMDFLPEQLRQWGPHECNHSRT